MLITVDPLHRLVRDIFLAERCSERESSRIATYLVRANLTGHDSHGVIRAARYVSLLRDGLLVRDQKFAIVTENESFAVVDGGYGFGQTIAPQAVELGTAKACKAGVSVIALRNSGHVGRVGEWAEMAAEANLCSIHFVNVAGSQLVAPYGGVERRFSTAPFAAGFPVKDGQPVILDFATSLVAEGKVLSAASGGKPIPDNSLIAPDGRLSGDPSVLYGPLHLSPSRSAKNGTGAIRAFGDHKGSGLAFMCELLAGALTGSGCAGPKNRPFANGMLSIYIAPAHFGSMDEFYAETRTFIGYVRSCRPDTPDGEILLPGDVERRTTLERSLRGISLPEETWQRLCSLAEDAGLAVNSYV
jgi:hydroxycarboxylate dehydrogenase B